MSQLMSSFQLTTYPIIALVLFLAAFAAVCVMIFRRSASPELQRAGAMALDEGTTASTAGARSASVAAASPEPANVAKAKKACSGGCTNCRGGKGPREADAVGHEHAHAHGESHGHQHMHSTKTGAKPAEAGPRRCCSER